MDDGKLLSESAYCRLCCAANVNGINIFTQTENSEDMCSLVNRYLPIKVENDDPLPKTICPGCHIQLEATKLFMDLVIEGQAKLRILLKNQQDLFDREEKERQKLEKALQNHNPNASVETYTIQTDDSGEKYIIQIYSKGPLFSSDHELALKAEGLTKPKRKRGRPPKINNHETVDEIASSCKIKKELENKDDNEQVDNDGRKRRRIRAPVRYQGVVQGAELDHILKKEGVLDEDADDVGPSDAEEIFNNVKREPLEIGKVITSDGKDLGQSVYVNNRTRKHRQKRKSNSGVKYTCEICKKSFLHKGRYELHKKNHKIKYVCQGECCNMEYEKKDDILEHQNETGHAGFSLMQDIRNCNGSLILQESEKLEDNADILSSIPEKVEDNSADDDNVKCPKCDKSFSCKQNYEVHLKAIHNGEKPFKCELCDRTFAYAYSLKCHMVSHKNVIDKIDQISCDKCDKVFNHPSSLLYHKDTEHGNQRFICNKCHRTFRHRQLLQRHQLVHSDERPFKCNMCDQTFKTRSNLINHEIVHTGVKRFVCTICGHSFGHKTSLSIHLRWHNGSKPYQCDFCQKSFSQKGNLMEHVRIHTGEKPFCCDICGRSFTTSSQWKLHRKRHTGEKPFTCEYCQKKFLHKETYMTHIRRHLNIRPFKCRFCSRAFSENWACSRHEKLHYGEKPYKCDICDKAFADASNFTKHRRTHPTNHIKNDIKENLKSEICVNKTSPVMQVGTMSLLRSDDTNLIVQKDQTVELKIEAPSLQIQELLDNEGNPISFTTADGQPIPIVSSDSKKFQGLMPDGTLVSIDIVTDQTKEIEQEEVDKAQVSLLNTEIQFLNENIVTNTNETLPEEKPAFLSEDGKVCFITSFDENSFLTIN
ncbi:hypothetical protein GWI33_017690 [Rhynchophorus ferrugineus]|uniref:Uncharacterized protein n=1 Tax=Rhynchophorus ferrugineus TaxID=354439 RepID=A0A834M3H4_RHYFE|nr:hypothetical protein GWI33_017690 [Rhynchophorus ferrugineus]